MTLPEDIVLSFPELEAALSIPIDVAIDEASQKLGLPLLGGPSGKGWSYFSVAASCPWLWTRTYPPHGKGFELTTPPAPLQIGALYHSLMAMFYGYGLGGGEAFYHRRGLLAPGLVEKLGKRGPKAKRDWVSLPPDGADKLLAELKAMAEKGLPNDLERSVDDSVIPEPRPSLSIILEAERLFDAHTGFYGSGEEDLEPLAIEWFAEHPLLGYTCRYDAIMRLGPNDPFVREGQLDAGGVVIIERKSAKWLNEWAKEGWFLDGEILGQLLLWEPSGCAKLFGPLAGLIVDIVTKEKSPKFERILVPKNPVTTRIHEQNIRYQKAEMEWWRATGVIPRRFVSCWKFGKKCALYEECRSESAAEAADLPTLENQPLAEEIEQ